MSFSCVENTDNGITINSNEKNMDKSNSIPPDDLETINQIETQKSLVTFNGKAKYSEPELTWKRTIAPTVLQFLSSDKLGEQYEHDMFVGTADA